MLKKTNTNTLYFGVKYYALDPGKQLKEEITRYQFFLQLKRDMLQGRLTVSTETAAQLGAFSVQSELGDYDPQRHLIGYVSGRCVCVCAYVRVCARTCVRSSTCVYLCLFV